MQSFWRPIAWAAALGVGLLGLGCSSGDEPARPISTPSTEIVSTSASAAVSAAEPAPHPPTASSAAPEPLGDAARGKALLTEFQCARCHDGLDEVPAIATASHCVKCHQDVEAGKFDHKPDHAKWKKNVAQLVAVPSLAAAGERLRYEWLVGFLMSPRDLRPHLVYDMPRLALERSQARDIATYLASLSKGAPEALDLDGADEAAGKKLLVDKGCGSCHTLSGSDVFASVTPPPPDDTRVALMLAPDLRHARERLRADAVMAWLRDPNKVKPGTLMPQTPMTDREAKNIVAFVMNGPLVPAAPADVPTLPSVLDREVRFDEVNERVFAKICRHCHGNPDEAIGDGGPGNTGGFGFKPRGLELTSFQRVMAGYTDDSGERHSVFAKTSDGTPRLVASLMARYAERAGQPNPEVRGMPLGLPPLALDDIQLLVTWIAQGRKR